MALIEWLLLFPVEGFLPVIAHTLDIFLMLYFLSESILAVKFEKHKSFFIDLSP